MLLLSSPPIGLGGGCSFCVCVQNREREGLWNTWNCEDKQVQIKGQCHKQESHKHKRQRCDIHKHKSQAQVTTHTLLQLHHALYYWEKWHCVSLGPPSVLVRNQGYLWLKSPVKGGLLTRQYPSWDWQAFSGIPVPCSVLGARYWNTSSPAQLCLQPIHMVVRIPLSYRALVVWTLSNRWRTWHGHMPSQSNKQANNNQTGRQAGKSNPMVGDFTFFLGWWCLRWYMVKQVQVKQESRQANKQGEALNV